MDALCLYITRRRAFEPYASPCAKQAQPQRRTWLKTSTGSFCCCFPLCYRAAMYSKRRLAVAASWRTLPALPRNTCDARALPHPVCARLHAHLFRAVLAATGHDGRFNTCLPFCVLAFTPVTLFVITHDWSVWFLPFYCHVRLFHVTWFPSDFLFAAPTCCIRELTVSPVAILARFVQLTPRLLHSPLPYLPFSSPFTFCTLAPPCACLNIYTVDSLLFAGPALACVLRFVATTRGRSRYARWTAVLRSFRGYAGPARFDTRLYRPSRGLWFSVLRLVAWRYRRLSSCGVLTSALAFVVRRWIMFLRMPLPWHNRLSNVAYYARCRCGGCLSPVWLILQRSAVFIAILWPV